MERKAAEKFDFALLGGELSGFSLTKGSADPMSVDRQAVSHGIPL
jgi:hypothetical protein